MKMRAFWIIIGLLGFAILVSIILALIPLKPTKNAETLTIVLIKKIFMDLGNLEEEKRNDFIKQAKGLNSSTINENLYVLLNSDANNFSTQHLFVDKWGTPLLFMPTNDTQFSRINSFISMKSNPLAIWSAGANHINEFGSGDDVY